MRSFSRLAFAAAAASAIIPAVDPSMAGAQSSCVPASRASESPAPLSGEVLGRRISLHANAMSLREALDRVAAAAHVRLSYSAELLDLSRSVCLDYESASVGRILGELVGDAPVRPMLLGTDAIVLTPSLSAVASPKPSPILKSVELLDRVVVTGSALGSPQRPLPVALDVVTGKELTQQGSTSISRALDGAIPGIWLWEQSPLTLLARYGSIRGASSFGVSYPKVYIDGIEVANSLLVTHLDPESILRIEVIRGPQGAALYGAEAISGVMNIVTRQEGTEDGAPHAAISTQGGASSSNYAAGSVLSQSHAVSLQTGTGVKSARLGATLSTIGAFIPGASSQQATASGGLRFVRSRGVINGSFRFFAQNATTPASPVLRAAYESSSAAVLDSSNRQSVREFTAGTTATFAQNDHWTHNATAGVDGYSLQSAAMRDGVFSSPLDSALRAATGKAFRTTLRASSVGQFGSPEGAAATITLGAEHSFVQDETVTTRSTLGGVTVPMAQRYTFAESRSNAGLIGQAGASFHQSFFVSGGVRVERNTGLVGIGDIAVLPMAGAAAMHSFGVATVKLRAAFGRGIRPPQTSNRSGLLMGIGGTPSAEQQSGIEAGADVFIGSTLALHATRFDQHASGLIQPVSVYSISSGDFAGYPRVVYELQNVGRITNRGWEFSGSVSEGHFSLGATLSRVDSRVRRLAALYTGDLRTGDRMLEVPATTFGANAGYAKGRLTTAWSISRASDWINYDRISLLRSFTDQGSEPQQFVGSGLRTWWKQYHGVTRIGGRVGLSVSRAMTITLDGKNLLDEQRGEPDNIAVLPGRTLSAGLRVQF